MKRVLPIVIVALFFFAAGVAYAADWLIVDGNVLDMKFSFNNSELYFGDQGNWAYGTYFSGDSDVWIYAYLLQAGNWAVVGSVVDGNLIADPYARFIRTGYDWGLGGILQPMGYIAWDPNTPLGYTTTLLLGQTFNGNNGVTIGSSPNTTLYVETISQYYGGYHDGKVVTTYQPVSHSFTATFDGTGTIIPEPSSLLALLGGMGSIAGIMFRRKR